LIGPALGAILALIGGLLVWYAIGLDKAHTRLDDIEARLMALEARQSRLQRVVERGWTQSLDLTSFDWSRQSQPHDEG
jgi:hypothetical protein